MPLKSPVISEDAVANPIKTVHERAVVDACGRRSVFFMWLLRRKEVRAAAALVLLRSRVAPYNVGTKVAEELQAATTAAFATEGKSPGFFKRKCRARGQ